MFGMGFGELVLVIIVAIVAIGPKDLPKVLRTLGQWAGKLRRMALDLRVQSGIDDVLRHEGLTEDLQEIRKLARGELDGIRSAATISRSDVIDPEPVAPTTSATGSNASSGGGLASQYADDLSMATLRHREYPREGADAYDALPDTAVVYIDALTKSPLARDPLYMTGAIDGVLPELPPEPAPALAVMAASDAPSDAAEASADSPALLPTELGLQPPPPKADDAAASPPPEPTAERRDS